MPDNDDRSHWHVLFQAGNGVFAGETLYLHDPGENPSTPPGARVGRVVSCRHITCFTLYSLASGISQIVMLQQAAMMPQPRLPDLVNLRG